MGKNGRDYGSRGRGLLIAGLSLLVVALFGAVILFSGFFQLRSGSGRAGKQDGKQESDQSAQIEVVFPEKDDLILYLGSSQKNQDGSFTVPAAVLCGESLKDQTVSVEAAGYGEVLSLANDGSGKLSGNLTLRPGNEEALLLQAKAGEKLSNEVPFYGAVEDPADDFINKPLDVLDGLNSYLIYLETTDFYSAETIARVEAYLKSSPAVSGVERIGEGLSFVTEDHYLGSYGLGRVTDDVAGFTDGKEVYQRYRAGENVSDKLIEGKSFPTNDRFLVITPEYTEDEVMRYHTDFSVPMLNEMRTSLGFSGQTEVRTDYDAIDCIRNGEFTDYGLVELNAHGLILQNQLFIDLGNGSKGIQFTNEENFVEKGSEAVLDGLSMHAFVPAMKEYLGIKDLPGDASQYFKMNFDYTPNPNDSSFWQDINEAKHLVLGYFSVMVSSSYLDHVLTGKTFDNTILYLFICYARSDDTFVQSMKSHGAALVYGCRQKFNTSVSLLSLARVTQALASKKADGLYESFTAGAYSVDAASSSQLVQQLAQRQGLTMSANRQPADMVASYQDSHNERPSADCAAGKENVSLKGSVVVTGQVLSGDSKEKGVPVPNAEIKVYRWLDHSFNELPVSAVTDAEGKYRIEGTDCGVCIIEATSGGSKAFVLHDTGEQMIAGEAVEEAEPILFKEAVLIVRAEGTHEQNQNYEAENLTCTVLIQGNPEASAAVNARLDEFHQNAEKVIADMRSADYPNNWYMMRMNDAYAGGAAGSVLLSDSTYYGGAHGFYSEFGDNFDLETGEKLTLLGMMDPENPGARESLRSLMLEYMNRMDGADALKSNVTFENVVEDSLEGNAGGFNLNADGLRIYYYQYEIGPYVAGMPDYTIPWNRLGGVLKEKYLPHSSEPSQGTASMSAAGGLSQNEGPVAGGGLSQFMEAAAGHTSQILGKPAPYKVTAQGLVRELKIKQAPDNSTVEKLLFYASRLENSSAYTGAVPPEQCSVGWK